MADSITFWDKEKVLRHHEQRHGSADGAPASVSGDGDSLPLDSGRQLSAAQPINASGGSVARGAMRRVFDEDPENGAWAWKPAVILEALERAKPGDFVVYADTSRYFTQGVRHSFVPVCDWLTVGRGRGKGRTRLHNSRSIHCLIRCLMLSTSNPPPHGVVSKHWHRTTSTQ